mmetsp:Transcript_3441/g.13652  ORF Transcript_3441/g.13652 Transcript_3441/m.13652 type:complete len:488 (-) Transcript_3441:84-1547(-)
MLCVLAVCGAAGTLLDGQLRLLLRGGVEGRARGQRFGFLDLLVELRQGRAVLDAQRHGNDGHDVRLGAVDMHGDVDLLADLAHLAKALLVVGTAAADPDAHVPVAELLLVGLERGNDALEGARDVGEVGDAAADDQHLAARILDARHEPKDGLGVVEGLLLVGSSGVLAVVRQLGAVAKVGDGVGVHDRGSPAGHHGPDATGVIQNRQLERRTSLGVEIGNVLLFREGRTSKSRGEVDVAPFVANQEVRGLVDLGGEVQHRDLVIHHHERIDLEVHEVQLAEETEERKEEVRELGLARFRHVHEQRLGDHLRSAVGAHGHREANCLGVNVSNVHSTLVVEEELVGLAMRLDADVVLIALVVGHERFHNERLENAGDTLHLRLASDAFVHPVLHLRPALVDRQETSLTTALDELIRLDHQRRVQEPRVLGSELFEVVRLVLALVCDLHAALLQGVQAAVCAVAEPLAQHLLAMVLADGLGTHGSDTSR